MTFPSPFDPVPAPVARDAADALMTELRARFAWLDAPGMGKMFGVLVCEGGTVLRGFSGMLADAGWFVDGFVPPLFDVAARDAIWPAGQRTLRDYERALRALDADPERLAAAAALAAARGAHAAALDELRARHRARRAARHAARRRGDASAGDAHALDQQSRADTAERRAFDDAHDATLAALAAPVAAFDAERSRLEAARADESRRLMTLVHDSYVLRSFAGERADLRSLFAPGEPPAGAGDCAGPKLLGHAYRLGLRPLALAEFWFGAPAGGRVSGRFYPSCRGKCGPILPFLLRGLPHAPAPAFASRADAPLRTLYEDAHLLVVDKPVDLLSVPGRSHRDSVLTRIPGVTVVHRLDLDVSGVLLCAKDAPTHALLQRAFATRAIDKRYIAVLEAAPRDPAGTIELPLRVDLDDRPRQLVDPVHGKPAVTDYRVLDGRRVALFPRTGRSHQLRVHCATALSPIVGDRLYGTPGARLLLHAESLSFAHPHTGARITVEAPAPF